MGTGTLNDTIRAFLVNEFACYSSPSDAIEAVKQRFDIKLSKQAVSHYDAENPSNKRLAKKWRALFAVVREAFLKDLTDQVPAAQVNVRVRNLARAAETMKQRSNYIGMAHMYERIAKELGGSYTNRYEHTGKDGGAIKYEEVGDMTDEMLGSEIDRLWAKREAARLGRGIEVTPTTTLPAATPIKLH